MRTRRIPVHHRTRMQELGGKLVLGEVETEVHSNYIIDASTQCLSGNPSFRTSSRRLLAFWVIGLKSSILDILFVVGNYSI